MDLNMWNRIAATLSFALILWSGPAYGDEGKFTLVPRGGTVSFEATCFDSKATAKLLTWKEFLSEEYKTKCEYEKQALVLDSELIIKNMQTEPAGEPADGDNERPRLTRLFFCLIYGIL